MSELPEIEATRRILTPLIVGKEISGTRIARPDRVGNTAPEVIADALQGQKIGSLERTGKYLRICMASGGELVAHFRMMGIMELVPQGTPDAPHTIITLALDDGQELRMRDQRCLSLVWYFGADEDASDSGYGKLGPDALEGDISGEYLKEALGRKERNLKTTLLDQHVVAGIGNSYADQILFEAGISPLRQASSLSDQELDRLARVIPRVLRLAAERNVQNPERMGNEPSVRSRRPDFVEYARNGHVCRKCGNTLIRAKVAGRNTVYCPACQK